MTYNTKYYDFHAAADKPDGLSVVAVFLLVWKNKKQSMIKTVPKNVLDRPNKQLLFALFFSFMLQCRIMVVTNRIGSS